MVDYRRQTLQAGSHKQTSERLWLCNQFHEKCVFIENFAVNYERIKSREMTVFHDEIEIEDFEYDEEEDLYHYPCPCGDRFEITKVDLLIRASS